MDASLSSEQTEKILQFQDLTGIDNMTVCRDILQRHAWDLEVAVQDQLNMSEGRPSIFSSENPAPSVISDSVVQRVFTSPPSGYNRWGGKVGFWVSIFVQFCYNSLASVLKLAFSLFWRDNQRSVTDPVGDVLRFVQYFNETYGSNHPVFYQGSYSQALNDAKRELRFLLVYLHQDSNPDCNNFCRTTLCSESVVEYVNSGMLVWGCNVGSGEGSQVAQTLRPSGFPFLAVIVLRDFHMTLVGRMQGPMTGDEFVARLQDIVDLNEGCLESARADRIAREVAQTLRREQDEAYLESLKADQEKERRRYEQLEKKRQEEEEARQLVLDEQRKTEEIQQRKIELASEVPCEPEASDPGAVSIVFKLPGGERVERRFLSSHTVRDVFNYIFCHPLSPNCFELTTNFPKRVLPCESDATKTLSEVGLQRKEVLFVHDLDA